jgi:hypothetical protein
MSRNYYNQLTLWSRVLLQQLTVGFSSQEISCLLWNTKVHYCVHNSLPPAPILSQMNPIHTLQPYINKIHSNFIFPSMPRSSEWPLPFRLSNKKSIRIFIYPCMLQVPPI